MQEQENYKSTSIITKSINCSVKEITSSFQNTTLVNCTSFTNMAVLQTMHVVPILG